MKKILSLMLALLLPLCVLLTSVQVAVLSDSFFYQQYVVNEVPQATKIELPELMRITDEIQKYLFGQRADFMIDGIIDGERQHVFNEREISHMDDVYILFARAIIIRNLSLLFIAVLVLILFKINRRTLYNTFVWSSGGFFVMIGFIGSLLYFNFNRYFVLFHEVFFKNDLWMLDPKTSILINMVPIHFFISIVTRILVTTALVMGAVGMIGFIKRRFHDRNERIDGKLIS